MNVERKTLVLQNRRISIQMELLADQLVAQKGLTAAQANMLFGPFRRGNLSDGDSQ